MRTDDQLFIRNATGEIVKVQIPTDVWKVHFSPVSGAQEEVTGTLWTTGLSQMGLPNIFL